MVIKYSMYHECPLCGKLHDDGTIYDFDGSYNFICFDCDDNLFELKKSNVNEYNKIMSDLFEDSFCIIKRGVKNESKC